MDRRNVPSLAALALVILVVVAPRLGAAQTLEDAAVYIPLIGNSLPPAYPVPGEPTPTNPTPTNPPVLDPAPTLTPLPIPPQSIAPNDPLYATGQWDMAAIGVEQAWRLTTGSRGVTVAVVDTGIDVEHPEFAGRLVSGAAFVSYPGNCGAHTVAYDDDDGHGTHVAGIVGAAGNNGVGIAGVAWETTLMPVKVLNCDGAGSISDVIEGITWAADNGAQIINLSLGWRCSNNEGAITTAIDYARSKGALVIAAAGNYGDKTLSGVRNPLICPAALPQVVSVGATTSDGAVAPYSTYNDFVDLAAPGGVASKRVLSTYPHDVPGRLNNQTGDWYDQINGTSQAAPHVAGVAALMFARNNSLAADDAAAILERTAADKGPTGRDPYYGAGLLDAGAAVAEAQTLPLARITNEGAGDVQPIGGVLVPGEYHPGVVLVQWQADAPAEEREALRAATGATMQEALAQTGIEVWQVPSGQEAQIAETLQASPLVESAGLDAIAMPIE